MSAATRSIVTALALVPLAWSASAAPPNLQTPAPVIYLADNLDEQESLGFCIDTVGRGFGDRLHTHSCKPNGGDVQYFFDADTGRIGSPTFENKCAELLSEPAEGVRLGLLDCSDGPRQRFVYQAETQEIQPADAPSLCLAAGPVSLPAGRFVKRDLLFADCATTEPGLKQWVVKSAP
jgi:hypothetical protein